MRWLALIWLVAGCQLDWPAASRRDDLPESDRENGPLHRAGQPCVWCHGGPGGTAPSFYIGGTIYQHENDSAGVGGATVTITDANGTKFTGTSNEVGNIYMQSGRRGREGAISAPTAPVFPLHVEVTLNGVTSKMRSQIGREGSCAVCHAEPPGATTVGKVWISP